MITVRKRDHAGALVWEYPGRVLEEGENFIRLEAFFNRDDLPFEGIILKRNDRFVETFFTDRWYNIFEIYDRDDGRLKGWYCNVGHPACRDEKDVVSYRDLLLDLWVTPDGVQHVLDEDEFAEAELDVQIRAMALEGLFQLRQRFGAGES